MRLSTMELGSRIREPRAIECVLVRPANDRSSDGCSLACPRHGGESLTETHGVYSVSSTTCSWNGASSAAAAVSCSKPTWPPRTMSTPASWSAT